MSFCAILLAHILYYVSSAVPVIHDALGYLRIAREMQTHGIFHKYEMSELRTYGYPAILSLLLSAATTLKIEWRLFMFEAQLAVHLAAAFAIRSSLLRLGAPLWAARAALIALALNPFLLIYSAHLLSDGLSASFAILLVACGLRLPVTSRLAATIAAGSLVCGASVMLRPSNAFAVPVWLAAVMLTLYRRQWRRRRAAAALAVIVMVLPWIPQIRNNLVYYGRATPLIASNLTGAAIQFGVRVSKYATSNIVGMDTQVRYTNPFYDNELVTAEAPLRWYALHPLKGAGTLALHAFNLVDQDLPFPYSTTLSPPYYVYVTSLHWAVLGLAGFGAVWFWLIRGRRSPAERFAVAFAGAFVVCQIAAQCPFHAETRYGLPSLAVLYPAGALTVAAVWRHGRRLVIPAAAAAAVCAAGSGLAVSQWVRSYSPQIRADRQLRMPEKQREMAQLIGGSRKVPKLTLRDGSVWTLAGVRLAGSGAAVLVYNEENPYSFMATALTIKPFTTYTITLEARSLVPLPSEGLFSVGLFGGRDASRPGEQAQIAALSQEFAPVSVTLNSGAESGEGSVRVRSMTYIPIELRSVSIQEAVAIAPGARASQSGQP
jgi:4-amino-4-deoxy-L-arabinose transferase-like glycosyltransferase